VFAGQRGGLSPGLCHPQRRGLFDRIGLRVLVVLEETTLAEEPHHALGR